MRITTLLLIVLLSLQLFAGDPGPLEITMYSVTPSWRDAQSDLAHLKSKLFRTGIGFKEMSGTVVLTTIYPGSAASKSTLQLGDSILAVDGIRVVNSSTCKEAFDHSQNLTLSLTIKREQDTLAIEVNRSFGDPLYYKLSYFAQDHYGSNIEYGTLSSDKQRVIEENVFTSSKGFRTEDAHKRLKGHFPEGTLIMIRGGKRVLFVLPGWSTVCVNVSDYDGELLTNTRLEQLWKRIVGKYEDWRNANP